MINVAEICKNLIMQRFNFPQNTTNPQDVVQQMLNTGQVTQDQLNKVMQIYSNPASLQQALTQGLKR